MKRAVLAAVVLLLASGCLQQPDATAEALKAASKQIATAKKTLDVEIPAARKDLRDASAGVQSASQEVAEAVDVLPPDSPPECADKLNHARESLNTVVQEKIVSADAHLYEAEKVVGSVGTAVVVVQTGVKKISSENTDLRTENANLKSFWTNVMKGCVVGIGVVAFLLMLWCGYIAVTTLNPRMIVVCIGLLCVTCCCGLMIKYWDAIILIGSITTGIAAVVAGFYVWHMIQKAGAARAKQESLSLAAKTGIKVIDGVENLKDNITAYIQMNPGKTLSDFAKEFPTLFELAMRKGAEDVATADFIDLARGKIAIQGTPEKKVNPKAASAIKILGTTK